MSVSQVCPGLFLSGLDSALNLSVLASRNITLIINASGLEDVSYPPLDGLQVLHVPVQDQPHAPLRQYFDLVAEQINQNQTGRTLVHCTAGRSRSPALIMAYLMRTLRGFWSLCAGLKVSASVGLMSKFWNSDPSSDLMLVSGDS
ncbi:dual specificity protein phosphatase 14 isoform X2 [Seriola aureovittata]|uniref:dual specificity protein phosphatase 14 isoform X2 n=1 Tax=Seriola aureovittata TaxID=2871759 RepID=UPI0024BD7795|nr:dual specificity protein phosphatase 14 isoform X2 [Seriola aureovittata]